MWDVMRPNIVYLMSDQQQAARLSCYGDSSVNTPFLAQLAAEGIVYESVICNGPLCMPARASLLTTRYVRTHGIDKNKGEVPHDLPTFVASLRDAGYQTAAIGKMHFWAPSLARDVDEKAELMHGYGFDETFEIVGKMASAKVDDLYTRYLDSKGKLGAYRDALNATRHLEREDADAHLARVYLEARPAPIDPVDHVDWWVGRKAVEWLRNYERSQPFFLWVGWPGPHPPYDAPRYWEEQVNEPRVEHWSRPQIPESLLNTGLVELPVFKHGTPEMLTEDAIRTASRRYLAGVAQIDRSMTMVFDALRDSGRLDDTWVIYSSDHGEMLGAHGQFGKQVFYEESVRVPLVVRPPEKLDAAPRAARVADLLEQIDIAATICELAGASMPTACDGTPLLSATGSLHSRSSRALSENLGMVMATDGVRKIIVEANLGTPLQAFNLHDDPNEYANLVATGDLDEGFSQLLEESVGPYLAARSGGAVGNQSSLPR
jgi:choline-sulfatase